MHWDAAQCFWGRQDVRSKQGTCFCSHHNSLAPCTIAGPALPGSPAVLPTVTLVRPGDAELLPGADGAGWWMPSDSLQLLGFCVPSAVNPAGNVMNYCVGVQEEPWAPVYWLSENTHRNSSLRFNLSLFPKANLLKQSHKIKVSNSLSVLTSRWGCAGAITVHITLFLWEATDYLIAVWKTVVDTMNDFLMWMIKEKQAIVGWSCYIWEISALSACKAIWWIYSQSAIPFKCKFEALSSVFQYTVQYSLFHSPFAAEDLGVLSWLWL